MSTSQRSGSVALHRHRRVHSGSNETLVSLPARKTHPVFALAVRGLMALVLTFVVVSIVYLDRDSYTDNHDGVVTLIDAIYYATVTITTTGYGDITPVTPHARIVNAIVVTPLRIGFLVLLVGTTLQVLATEGRRIFLDTRWRKHMRNHVVVVGYGTKGRSAVHALLDDGFDRHQIVVVDNDPDHIADAGDDGVAAVSGDGTRSDVLRRAEIEQAARVVVAVPRDDAAVLVTLTARRHNPTAFIVSAVRESENAGLLRDGGADGVVVSSEAAGRMLGVSAAKPATGEIFEDLLVPGEGLEMSEREVLREEVGLSPRESRDLVVAVVRDGTTTLFHAVGDLRLRRSDRVVVVRPAASGHAHQAPGKEHRLEQG